MAISQDAKKLVKDLIKAGKTQGYLSQDDVLEMFPEVEEDMNLLEYIITTLQEEDVEIIEPMEIEEEVVVTSEAAASRNMTFEQKINILKILSAKLFP